MSSLERRYRRLIRLLPRQHRAARGEELLGLLLDLDDDRTRPSARQTLGLIGLAIRLRLGQLPAAGTVLFSAFLIAIGTASIGSLIDGYTGASATAVMSGPTGSAVFAAVLLPPALARLGATVAWVLGARRTAAAFEAAAVVVIWLAPTLLIDRPFSIANLGRVIPLLDLALLCVLSVAARRRWTTPRPRPLWLAAVALALIAWKAVAVWGRHGIYYLVLPPYIGWAGAAVTAATAIFLLRRRPWPVATVASLASIGIGRLLPSVLMDLGYGRFGWLTTFIFGTVLLAVAGKLLTRQPRTDDAGRTG